jgi:tetratricopeptide (TPR) repeat protein
VRDSSLLRQQEPERRNVLGEIALAERRPLDAIPEFKLADQRPDGPSSDCTPCLPARLGRAYDAADLPDSTIAMYERYIATPYIGRWDEFLDASLLAGMHKRLGELYEARGDVQRAADHYHAFLELWKDADPELQPRVAEVRRRLARMREG